MRQCVFEEWERVGESEDMENTLFPCLRLLALELDPLASVGGRWCTEEWRCCFCARGLVVFLVSLACFLLAGPFLVSVTFSFIADTCFCESENEDMNVKRMRR
jgi:hypothetical protein